ncbi:MAG TPA: hypothetical protein DCZ93_00105 [Elusimicrobia bacterium]|nr:hypothetical protein [Elusimicrobiota bacterium]
MWKNYWPVYQKMEEEVKELSYNISFTDVHLPVYSHAISGLLLNICSGCEKSAKKIILKHSLRGLSRINFGKCGAALLGKYHKLSSVSIDIVWPYQNFSKVKISPFSSWQPGACKNPGWFTAYNKLKHDQKGGATGATLGDMLEALCGLFVLNLIMQEDEFPKQSFWRGQLHDKMKTLSTFFDATSVFQVSGGTTIRLKVNL